MFAYIYFMLGWSTQDTWWWHVDPVSGADKYAAKDDFVFGATGYGKTKFEATPTLSCFCKSGGSTSWTSPLCSELNTPFFPVPIVFYNGTQNAEHAYAVLNNIVRQRLRVCFSKCCQI